MGFRAGDPPPLASARPLSARPALPDRRYHRRAIPVSAGQGPVEAEINRLNNQILVHYYEREWNQVTQQ